MQACSPRQLCANQTLVLTHLTHPQNTVTTRYLQDHHEAPPPGSALAGHPGLLKARSRLRLTYDNQPPSEVMLGPPVPNLAHTRHSSGFSACVCRPFRGLGLCVLTKYRCAPRPSLTWPQHPPPGSLRDRHPGTLHGVRTVGRSLAR